MSRLHILLGRRFRAYLDYISKSGMIRAGPSNILNSSFIRNKGLFLNERDINNSLELLLNIVHEFGAHLGLPHWFNYYVLETIARLLVALSSLGKVSTRFLTGFKKFVLLAIILGLLSGVLVGCAPAVGPQVATPTYSVEISATSTPYLEIVPTVTVPVLPTPNMATVGQYEQERGITQNDPAALIRSLLVDIQQEGSFPVVANSANAYQDFMVVLDRAGAVQIVDSRNAGFAIMLIPRLVDNNVVVIDSIMISSSVLEPDFSLELLKGGIKHEFAHFASGMSAQRLILGEQFGKVIKRI